MAHNPALYHPKWTLIGRLIRKRAGNACEWCRARNRQPHPRTGSVVHLAVAHLDRDRRNNRFTNLACICQRCHLAHDAAQHLKTRHGGRAWVVSQYFLELPESDVALAVAAGRAVLYPAMRFCARQMRKVGQKKKFPQLVFLYPPPVLLEVPPLTPAQLVARRRAQQKAPAW